MRRWAEAKRRAAFFGAALCFCACPTYSVEAQGVCVEITGGRDVTGQWYNWVVHNHCDSAITYVEFPHYRVDVWLAPEDWQIKVVTHGDARRSKERPALKAWTDDPALSIQPGDSAKFTARIRRGGAYAGTGTVTIRFADGSELRVDDVDVPCLPPLFERVGMPLALALLLGLFLVYRRAKRARGATKQVSLPPSSSDNRA